MISALDVSLLRKSEKSSQSSGELKVLLKQLSHSADDNAIDRVIALHEKTIVALEKEIWKASPTKKNIEQYQNSFFVLEKLHELKTVDDRFSFKIIIPVADRPQHLKNCLNSLLNLCDDYNYGGYKNKKYHKISVLIADDSSNSKNIELHKRYCAELTQQGIKTDYFGLDEQFALVDVSVDGDTNLNRIISSTKDTDKAENFSHKGASIMRNITYLKLNHLLSNSEMDSNTLIYFIDSDQEFCINARAGDEDKLYAINYFHYLNEIFKTQNISILTGKVVGDPPVSPSVMAANFQQDVQNFLNTIKKLSPEETCHFHRHVTDVKDDAAYHDMANLFGFSKHEKAFIYHCELKGEHNNAACFNEFSKKLGHFFYGEHPTRKTFFHYGSGFTESTPARTVYTGNYVITPDKLDQFIPFSTLKLRMAGPVMGRILNNRLKSKFVSANLPMLHNRTVDSTGQSEFRAGVKHHDKTIDLGNEFIRQFYGDIMLFSVKKITEEGISFEACNKEPIRLIIDATYNNIKQSYLEKHNTILQLKSQISSCLDDTKYWWNENQPQPPNIQQAKINYYDFLNNIQSNFDESSNAYQQISSKYAEQYLSSILQAILHYQEDIDNWQRHLSNR